MKKSFETPKVDVCTIDDKDIIATSGETTKEVAQHAGRHIVFHVIKGIFGG